MGQGPKGDRKWHALRCAESVTKESDNLRIRRSVKISVSLVLLAVCSLCGVWLFLRPGSKSQVSLSTGPDARSSADDQAIRTRKGVPRDARGRSLARPNTTAQPSDVPLPIPAPVP